MTQSRPPDRSGPQNRKMKRNVNTNSGIGLMIGKGSGQMRKNRLIDQVLRVIHASGLGALFRPISGGRGGILMFHHVRPFAQAAFDPHRGLEIEPLFLDVLLSWCKQQGYAFVPLSELPDRLKARIGERFLCLTFDDGYVDNLVHALPILERHQAPFSLFVTTGYADHESPLWWRDIEDLLRPDHRLACLGQTFDLAQAGQRDAALQALMAWFVTGPSNTRNAELHEIMRAHDVSPVAHARQSCLDWAQIAALAARPLCTIGAHTLTHPLLATLDEATAFHEISASKKLIEQKLGHQIDQFAYPVGSALAAGEREVRLAQQAGFRIAVTTRSGMIFEDHAKHLLELPRASINGYHQSIAATSALLSGVPFLIANKGRRVVTL
jgi:peptidoglycan/xylan/chitin deacetylase (PgdA/CDA1 family)